MWRNVSTATNSVLIPVSSSVSRMAVCHKSSPGLKAGINTGSSIAGSSGAGGGNQMCSSTLLLFFVLFRNSREGKSTSFVGNPCAHHLLNKSRRFIFHNQSQLLAQVHRSFSRVLKKIPSSLSISVSHTENVFLCVTLKNWGRGYPNLRGPSQCNLKLKIVSERSHWIMQRYNRGSPGSATPPGSFQCCIFRLLSHFSCTTSTSFLSLMTQPATPTYAWLYNNWWNYALTAVSAYCTYVMSGIEGQCALLIHRQPFCHHDIIRMSVVELKT